MLYEHQTTLYKSYLYYFKNLCSYEYMRTIGRIGHLNGASTKQNVSICIVQVRLFLLADLPDGLTSSKELRIMPKECVSQA